jgi:hypothetical protein
MEDRRSHRKYKEEKLSFSELSFLLWATQGVQNIKQNIKGDTMLPLDLYPQGEQDMPLRHMFLLIV